LIHQTFSVITGRLIVKAENNTSVMFTEQNFNDCGIGTLFVFLCPPNVEIVQWAQTVFSHLNPINGHYLGELKMVSGLVKVA